MDGWISNSYDCCYWTFTTTRKAYIKNEIYTINYEININDKSKKCNKTEYCNDPITSEKCLKNKMDENYKKICYYNKNDSDICEHLSYNNYSINKLIITLIIIIMLLFTSGYIFFVLIISC